MPESLVFAARQLPYPADSGYPIRANRLVTGLSKAFDVTLVAFDRTPNREPAELERAFPGIDVVTVLGPDGEKRRSQARSLLSLGSWECRQYRSDAFSHALRDAVERTHAALVHFDDLRVGQFGPIAGTIGVFAPHDVQHRITRGTAAASTGARRAFAAGEWRKIKREEGRLWKRMPLSVAVSQIDARAFCEGGARQVEICPNGVDRVAQLPLPPVDDREPFRILFVGSGDYQPYERGLAWFVSEVLPRVRESAPVSFDVVGSPPRRPVTGPGVTYCGRVPSVEPWYERSHVAVVPVFSGSGTRLKIIEAMAYGRPVVSTALGVEGLPVEAGAHYLQAEDAEGFAHELVGLRRQCLDGDRALDALLARGREAVTPLFWPDIVERLVATYGSAIARDGGRSPRTTSASRPM